LDTPSVSANRSVQFAWLVSPAGSTVHCPQDQLNAINKQSNHLKVPESEASWMPKRRDNYLYQTLMALNLLKMAKTPFHTVSIVHYAFFASLYLFKYDGNYTF